MYIYEVKENDTLDSISKKFNVSYQEIIQNNQLESAYDLRVGLKLKVPTKNTTLFQLYKVRPKDTLYGISRKVGVDVDTLLLLNGLTSQSYIYPNQDLIVPRENIKLYVTKKDDTLDSIAREVNIPMEEILTYNEKIYLVPNQIIVHRKQG